ncbi:AraC family transcriptional regulator [Candidatus Parcubacteria bacterium]|nr:MAG: AraC family transcriptional regulator [Candidatus Parcubacteria bacterium]
MTDGLSDILRSIRLRSSVYFRADFPSPWGMEVEKGPVAQFHMVVWGRCWLQTPDRSEPLELLRGDIVVFPHGDAHWLADDPKSKRVPGKRVVQALHSDQLCLRELASAPPWSVVTSNTIGILSTRFCRRCRR